MRELTGRDSRKSPTVAVLALVAAAAAMTPLLASAQALPGGRDQPGGAAADPGTGADTLRLDLAACLAQARAASPQLAAAAAGSEESAALAAEAEARRRPVLGVGGNYQYTTEHMRRELQLGPGLPAGTLEFGDGHVADLNLGLAVPLFTGGELARTASAAGAGASAARERERSARLDLDRGIRLAHSGALGRLAQVEAARLAVDRLARHLGTVAGARDAGAATAEAQLRAEARLLAARQRLATAEAAFDSSALALGRMVGRPGQAVLPLGDVHETLLPDAAGNLAPSPARADLAVLEHEAGRQRELAAAARGRLRPRVLADVRAHYGRPGVDALANEWMPYGTAGVSIDWPLWDSGARTERARQAEARATLLDAQRRDLAEAVATALATARANLAAAVAIESQAGARLALQQRLLAMVEARQAQAAATGTEYLDAQDDLAQAEIDLALARTRVRLAEAALLWALGM